MEVKPVKIYTSGSTPRLRFIADLILNEILGLEWEIISDKRKLGKFPVINYSEEKINSSFKISPVPLLFDKGIGPQELLVSEWKGLPVFFQTSDNCDLPFDIFAASFYMVTRYEEYQEFRPDESGGFRSSGSLSSKNGFLGVPVVDLWVKELSKSLVRKFPSLTFKPNQYRSLLIFDVDEPFAYTGKNIRGNIGGFINDISSGLKNASRRLSFITRREKYPYKVFDYLTESAGKNSTDTKFFWPVGDHSEYDKNPSWRNVNYRDLINSVACRSYVGLQASYKASASWQIIKTELQRLRKITGNECLISRLHLLKTNMPFSYRNLTEAGINEDYSMGYSDEPGFRAGIARSFKFYDILQEKMTDLRIFPFMVTDAALIRHKKLKTAEAKEVISNLVLQTRKAGGSFTSIWHNTSLLDTPECEGWRDVFEFTLEEQKP